MIPDPEKTCSSVAGTRKQTTPTESNRCSNRAKYRMLAGHEGRAHPFGVRVVVRDLLYPKTNSE